MGRGELGRALNLNALTVFKGKKQQKMLTKKFFEELGSLYTVRHGEVPADMQINLPIHDKNEFTLLANMHPTWAGKPIR